MSVNRKRQGEQNSKDETMTSNTGRASASDAPLPEQSSTRATKRARIGQSISKATRIKASSTNKTLSRLTNLPIEIFHEIASFAHPGDLLSLSRSCKTFRDLLMKDSVAHIWRSAESNVEDLPHCPEDMCEPEYAALLFTKSCTSCGVTTSSKADPFLRVRMCSKCREIKLVEYKYSRGGGNSILGLVPFTTLIKLQAKDGRRRMYGSGSIRYSLADEAEEIRSHRRVLVATQDMKSLVRWRHKQSLYVDEHRQFGTLLNKFLLSVNLTRSGELEDMKKERRATIEKRLRTLGWSDADLEFLSSSVWFKWRSLLDQSKAITDRGWEKLLPQIVSLGEINRREHSEREKGERKDERRKQVFTLLQELKPQINPFRGLLGELGFDPSQPFDCLPCKNRHLRRTLGDLKDVQSHLADTHGMSETCKGVTHESSSRADLFHERTQEWKKAWKMKWDFFSCAHS